MDMCGCSCDPVEWRRMSSRRYLLKGAAVASLTLMGAGRLATVSAQDATPQSGDIQSGTGPLGNGSFINPLVEIHGRIEVGNNCYIAGNAILFAGADLRVTLGNENNVQDNAYLLAMNRDVQMEKRVSVSHQAVVQDSRVGEFVYFGYRSRVVDSVIEDGAMIMHGASVEGVRIPPDAFVPIGARITSQDEADDLSRLEAEDGNLKRDTQAANVELAAATVSLYESGGRQALIGVGPNPVTSWNAEQMMPRLAEGVEVRELVRIVGDVRVGRDGFIGQRSSIRADEGTPIIIGRDARIRTRVTFHTRIGAPLEIGRNSRIGDGSVIHGHLQTGDDFVTWDNAVVFGPTIGNDVRIGENAVVVGDFEIPSGARIPSGAVITYHEDVDDLD